MQCALDRIAIRFYRRTERAKQHPLRIATAENDAVDQNVVVGLDIGAHGKITQFDGRGWGIRLFDFLFFLGGRDSPEIVDLDQTDAGCVIGAANNGGEVSGWHGANDCRFMIVRGREAALLNLCLLAARPPIVIGDRLPVTVVQFQDGIQKPAGDGLTVYRHGWPDGARDDAFESRPLHNEAGNTDLVAGLSDDAPGNV